MIEQIEFVNRRKAEFENCDRAGLIRNYTMGGGMTITADQVEKLLERLYACIDKLTEAYDMLEEYEK